MKNGRFSALWLDLQAPAYLCCLMLQYNPNSHTAFSTQHYGSSQSIYKKLQVCLCYFFFWDCKLCRYQLWQLYHFDYRSDLGVAPAFPFLTSLWTNNILKRILRLPSKQDCRYIKPKVKTKIWISKFLPFFLKLGRNRSHTGILWCFLGLGKQTSFVTWLAPGSYCSTPHHHDTLSNDTQNPSSHQPYWYTVSPDSSPYWKWKNLREGKI